MSTRWDDLEPDIWEGTDTVIAKKPISMVEDEQADWDELGDDDE